MLTRLSIRNIVLIEALDLTFARGLGVLTVSGGMGVLISDATAQAGLQIPAFSEQTPATLRRKNR